MEQKILLLIFFYLLNNSSANVIDSVCKATQDYKLCNESLESNPNSANEDAKGLARIMLYMALHKTTHIIVYVKRMIIENKFPDYRSVCEDCLEACDKNYNFILHHFVLNAIKYFEVEMYHDATFAIGLSGLNVSTCADACVNCNAFNLTNRSNEYAYFVLVVGDVIDYLY